jgi:hypothetical protein
MIRPSSLTIAEHCDLAPVLSAEFPETNANIERGQLVDLQVSRELLGGAPATDYDAIACIDALSDAHLLHPWVTRHVQEKIALCDPATGATITEGTPDFAAVGGETESRLVVIVDFKKREQWLAGRVADPDQNLQLHAYALAWAIRSGATTYKMALLLFGEGEATMVWSRVYQVENSQTLLDRIKRIGEKRNVSKIGGARPKATAGPHCLQCYPRLHCPSWTLPAHDGETALAPFTAPGGLTPENSGRALAAVMAIEEAAARAREVLKGYVAANGPIVVGDRTWGPAIMPGRKSGPSVADLEAQGLGHLVKVGRPFEQWRLQKRR